MHSTSERPRSPNTHAMIFGRMFEVGWKTRARGQECQVAYLDGKNGVVLESGTDFPPARFKKGSTLSIKGRRFEVLAVHNHYLTLRGVGC